MDPHLIFSEWIVFYLVIALFAVGSYVGTRVGGNDGSGDSDPSIVRTVLHNMIMGPDVTAPTIPLRLVPQLDSQRCNLWKLVPEWLFVDRTGLVP